MIDLLKFEMTEQEANLMINALAKEPYYQVTGLIAKLQAQATQQFKKDDEPEQ